MIIWIASYPRSGNGLLRTILNQQFGLSSTSDEVAAYKDTLENLPTTASALGYSEISENFEEFYRLANNSNDIKLIKTHKPPIDTNKAIYIVRDGRKAYLSYAKFHSTFNSKNARSLLNLVLGLDFYGGWSEHFRHWSDAPNSRLLLRYEDLLDPSQETLEKISFFLGVACPTKNWINPFAKLHEEHPGLFREGQISWKNEEEWNEIINAIFYTLNGSLMIELGYAEKSGVENACGKLLPEFTEILRLNAALIKERNEYQHICDERQKIITGLKDACDERLALIEHLSKLLKQI